MITFIPLISWFWMCVESLFATGSNKGKGALVIWVLYSDLLLSYQAHQISGQAIITLHVTLDSLTVYVQFITWNLSMISFRRWIDISSPFSYIQYIISSHHSNCGSEPVEFHNNLDSVSEQICHATITTIYWLISSIQQLIQCDTSVLTHLFLLMKGHVQKWNVEKCWLLVLATVTGLDSTSLMEIQIMVAFRFNVFLMFF